MNEIEEHVEEEPKHDLQEQLKAAKEEIDSLTKQLNCLLLLAKNAWRGDASATMHLARVIGVDGNIEENAFSEKKVSGKKTVKICDDERIESRKTPSVVSSGSQDVTDDEEQEQQEQQSQQQRQPQLHTQVAARHAYLEPFLKQSHIDPIQTQRSAQIFNNMIRHHQNEMRKSPVITNRNVAANVRPRATKHLYRPASADHVVRHLGSPLSRAKPYFVFAGKEFFRRTAQFAPLNQKPHVNSQNGSRQSQYSDLSNESDIAPRSTIESTVSQRPSTAKPNQQSSINRFGTRSAISDNCVRISSALSNASSTKVSQLSERERRDAMRLQRQLNLPRPGWLNQNT